MIKKVKKEINTEIIAKKGRKIYQAIKKQYEPKYDGKLLAIDTTTKKVYMGDDTIEAVEKGRSENPDTIFYVVKIGYAVAETLAKTDVMKILNDDL